MLAAVEIYNKPRIAYREEVTVILAMNAWELLLKGIVSKSGKSIFLPKKRTEPYRTLSLKQAMDAATKSTAWPSDISRGAITSNLSLLKTYRDNTVHFYNSPDMPSLIYCLLQPAILNFRDVLASVFDKSLAGSFSWDILPLAAAHPFDPISYLGGNPTSDAGQTAAMQELLAQVRDVVIDLDDVENEVHRVVAVISAKFESVKNSSASDVVVGISDALTESAVIVTSKLDPNKSHPLRQKDALERLVARKDLNKFGWEAVVWRYRLRDRADFCWIAHEGGLVKWSNEALSFVRSLSKNDVEEARSSYSRHLKTHSARRRRA